MLIQAGKVLIVVGLVIILTGLGLFLAGRWNIPLGRLPGDFQISRNNLTCLIPIATFIILSVLSTIILTLLFPWWNR